MAKQQAKTKVLETLTGAQLRALPQFRGLYGWLKGVKSADHVQYEDGSKGWANVRI